MKRGPHLALRLASVLMLVLTHAHGQPPTAPGTDTVSVYRRHLTIPMPEAGPAGLDGWLIVPRTPVKPPLLLLSDGVHFVHLSEVSPGALLPEALWFVRRGWAVAIVDRRGLGLSGGEDSDKVLHKMLCSEATFEWLQETDADDLRAAYKFLATQPDIDATRTVAVGSYFAGSAAMWLAAGSADPPPGLKAVINFDGGWATLPDWALKGKVHALQDAIVPSFAKLGASTKTPMLWLYSNKEADFGQRFGLKSANAAYQAFTGAGGVAEMHVLQQQGDTVQFLFDENPNEWGPLVEQFLAKLNLPATQIIPDPPDPDFAKLPRTTADLVKRAYVHYLHLGPNKAFVLAADGRVWAYASGKATLQQAKQSALSQCPYSDPCKVVASEEWASTP